MSLKLHFMDSRAEYFPEKFGDYLEEQGDRFHKDIQGNETKILKKMG